MCILGKIVLCWDSDHWGRGLRMAYVLLYLEWWAGIVMRNACVCLCFMYTDSDHWGRGPCMVSFIVMLNDGHELLFIEYVWNYVIGFYNGWVRAAQTDF